MRWRFCMLIFSRVFWASRANPLISTQPFSLHSLFLLRWKMECKKRDFDCVLSRDISAQFPRFFSILFISSRSLHRHAPLIRDLNLDKLKLYFIGMERAHRARVVANKFDRRRLIYLIFIRGEKMRLRAKQWNRNSIGRMPFISNDSTIYFHSIEFWTQHNFSFHAIANVKQLIEHNFCLFFCSFFHCYFMSCVLVWDRALANKLHNYSKPIRIFIK